MVSQCHRSTVLPTQPPSSVARGVVWPAAHLDHGVVQAQRRREGKVASELGERQRRLGHGPSRLVGEGARAARLAWNICGHRETVADPLVAAERQHALVGRRQRDHEGHARQAKSRAGHMARAVNRIADAKCVPVIIVGPLRRIVVQPDRVAARRDDVDMVRQREILEADLGRYRGHRQGEIIGASDRFDGVHEMRRQCVQAHRPASRPQAAPQATGYPTVALSGTYRPNDGFSGRRPATPVIKAQYHRHFGHKSGRLSRSRWTPNKAFADTTILVALRRDRFRQVGAGR